MTDPAPTKTTSLPGTEVVSPTAERAAHALADRLVRHLTQRLHTAPAVHLALSGGSSGALFCDVLADRRELSLSEWLRIHLWMVDERSVPDDDPRLNFALIRDRLAPRVPVPSANLHPMPVLDADGAAKYESKLASALAPPACGGCLDAVVLGVGADGHTASLFPHSPALDERTRRVAVNDGPSVTPPRPRMTLTYPALGSARLIAFLVTGANKRAPLAKLTGGSTNVDSLPIAGIVPSEHSEMAWFIDQDAAPTD